MTVVVVRCPKCSSTQCAPSFYTPYSIGCMSCDHEFDLRGSFWTRLWGFITGRRFAGFHG
jgi:hypothetical protein